MLTPAWHVSCELANKHRNLASRLLPPAAQVPALSGNHAVPPLSFPSVPSRLPELIRLGLEHHLALLLHEQFVTASKSIDASLLEDYYLSASKFCENLSTQVATRSDYLAAVQQVLLKLRSQSIERIWSSLVSHATALVATAETSQLQTLALHSSSGCCGRRKGRPQAFSKEQTAALNALLKYDDQYSSEEKDVIAHELNLTREQINRWFCNARARKKPYYKHFRRSGSPPSQSALSQYLCDSSSGNSEQMSNPGSLSSRSSASGDCSEDMVITTSGSNSSTASEAGGDPMDSYFEFPAYQQSESWAQKFNASTPSSSQSLDLFNFNPLDPNLPSSYSSPSADPSSFSWTPCPSF